LENIGTTIDAIGDSQALSLISLDQLWQDPRFLNFKGKNYSTVIIDSGIDLNHPFFGPDANNDGIADKIIYQYDFADNDNNASDKNNHGSHVASIVSSVVPDANLIVLKVFQDNGSGSFADLEKALQWVNSNANTYNIASVNLSIGDSQNWTTATGRYGISDELAAIANQNVIISAAAGNSFYQFNSVQGLAYPAIDPNVVPVGAVWSGNFGGSKSFTGGAIDYSTSVDQIASFSQRDDLLKEVFAPGILIKGASATGGTVTMGGTSQAVPFVTGLATLAQEMSQEILGRWLSVSEFRDLLHTTGDLIVDGDNENDNVVNTGLTFPRINALKLAEGILSFKGIIPDPNTGNSSGNGESNSSPSPNTVSLVHTVNLVGGEIKTDINFGNNQVIPSLAIASTNATQTEGNSSTKAFTFTVSRTGDTTNSSSANWAVTGFGANQADATDFGGTLPTGTVSFAAGETSQIITVNVSGDTTVELDEGFTVNLSNPVDATISNGTATGTITDDDNQPKVISGTDQGDDINATTGQTTVMPGKGDDIIRVNSASVVIIELPNEGNDTVFSSVNYNLASLPQIENLTLTGTANINGIGNRNDNVITGNSGQNVLTGLQGNDTFVFNL
ncbi:S8 family serine peptidase, partial [Cylindrospermopsis raciborskii]|uniref:S8 family serine peptidase n=1 Tax=Cylindrospermopsis raciborskii TaxID=77022 RepID=UPI0038D0C89C